MNKRVVLVSLLPLLLIAVGCQRPRLASRPLTEEELEWSQIIRTSYPAWKAPFYSTLQKPDGQATVSARGETSALPVPAAPDPVWAPVPEPEGGEVELIPVEAQR